MAAIQWGKVVIGVTPTLIFAPGSNNTHIVVSVSGGPVVYVGGPTVSIATGIPTYALNFPLILANNADLYGIAVTPTDLRFLVSS